MTLELTRPRTAETVRAEIAEDPEREQLLRDATAELLTATETFMGRYVALPSSAAAATLALYVLHTWAIDACDATPYLVIYSNEPGSGKTRLLEVLNLLVRKPWQTSSTTEAALFRKIEDEHPTLLLDEIDTVFSYGKRHEALRAVLNAGNRRGATVTRCDGKGSTREHETFGAKVLSGLDNGELPATVADRSIIVRMRRRAAEQSIERFRPRIAEHEAGPVKFTLEAWTLVAADVLARLEPPLPETLSDRAVDAWEPLLAIGAFAGGEWADRAQRAAHVLSAPQEGAGRAEATGESHAALLPGLQALWAPAARVEEAVPA